MAPLLPRGIDWINDAPVAIGARAVATAAPADVFAVLADHERWPEWFPAVRHVAVLGPAAGVGARRRVTIRGGTVDEEFIVWEPGARWAFTGTSARPRFTRSLVEDCQLAATGSGGTDITYTMYLDPPALLRPLTKLAARAVRANIERTLTNLARRAALARP